MGNRHIKVRIENSKDKYPDRRHLYNGVRKYTLYLTRYENHWNGSEYLSLKDLEIIRDYLTEFIQTEKSRRKNK